MQREYQVTRHDRETHLLILIDSCSSNNFISEKLVEKLQCLVEQLTLASVRVVGGGLLTCTRQVLGLQWWCQGTSFTTSLKALPLDNYDIILGMNWLETMSPMWVDSRKKIMNFSYRNTEATLTGILETATNCK